ncbi:MAG TPA: hypothetical protein VHB49_20280 [Bradyrhizobium sp.]|nr:hypothetical protein [Bradyrhizobium sp.]
MSGVFGPAAGANYWFSAHRLAGFALAGGGTLSGDQPPGIMIEAATG